MSSPNIPYNFAAPLYIWHDPSLPTVNPADVVATCQWRAYDEVHNFGHAPAVGAALFLVELVVPVGTDIRDGRISSTGAGDVIARADFYNETYYQVLWVERIYVGFPKECYRVVARRLSEFKDQALN